MTVPKNTPTYLQFGIPTLDILIGRDENSDVHDAMKFGLCLDSKQGAKRRESATFALVGPDGVGKSTIALHLASTYRMSTLVDKGENGEEGVPRIIYISTDLSFERANSSWIDFLLNNPPLRHHNLQNHPYSKSDIHVPKLHTSDALTLNLTPFLPMAKTCHELFNAQAKPKTISEYLMDPSLMDIAFVDLESATAGDDWLLVNRIIASLEERRSPLNHHLVIIDAVEGLDMRGDGFGRIRSRRSKIAQIIRKAERKCHVVFIVEESLEYQQRRDEQFATDVVIRFHQEHDASLGRNRLYVEVGKARGQRNVKGKHRMAIRSKNGRFDESKTYSLPDFPSLDGNYVHVFHSLEFVAERWSVGTWKMRVDSGHAMSDVEPPQETIGEAGLDSLTSATGVKSENVEKASVDKRIDTNGEA